MVKVLTVKLLPLAAEKKTSNQHTLISFRFFLKHESPLASHKSFYYPQLPRNPSYPSG